jgi:biopolymer transport protein ExbB
MRWVLKGLVALLIVLLSGQAWAWWNEAWPYRMKIQVDGARISAPLSQVPVAVRLHNGNFPFSGCKPDGSDLRFVAADETTLLPFHLDKFDASSGIAVVWVQLPTLGTADAPDHFWLYYGNDQAAPAQDAARTYDPHQSLVLHFSEQEASPKDSSGHAHPTLATELVVTPAGVMHAAARLSGASAIKLPAAATTRQSANRGLTFSTWIKPDGAQPNAVLFEQRDGARALLIGVDAGGVYARIERGPGKVVETPRAALTPGQWQHLGLIAADRLTLYLNGQEVAAATARLDDLGGDIHLGNDATGQRGFKGEMDETGLASVARPAAWMQVASALGPDGNLLVYGEEEGEAAADGAYLGIVKILVDSVSPEGWVVIGLIGLLGLVSLEAGVNKSIYLGRTEQANRVFQSRLKGLPVGVAGALDDPLATGEPSADIRHASLLRLYRRAMEELGHMLELHEQSGYGRRLSPQGLEALRSSLDVVMVDEVQRLNHKLVLLTLSVSGAPFLGLFGTVVGIMITFATIAATGDVNVNTIAPGVAAALTTTVAGLMVAIPVMFAYNHLTLRISNLTSAMEVFADELVGQLALAHTLKGREHASPQPG